MQRSFVCAVVSSHRKSRRASTYRMCWHWQRRWAYRINEVTLRRARLVLRWVPFRYAGIPSRYVISHPGQLSLLPLAGWEMSTGQRADEALRLRSKGRHGLFHLRINVWVAGKTVLFPCLHVPYTWAPSEMSSS